MQSYELAEVMDVKLIEQAKPALEKREAVVIELPIRNVNRAVGTMLSGEMTRRYGGAGLPDDTRHNNPLVDPNLLRVAERLLNDLRPAVLLITLGELGMLLCQHGQKPFHIPTVAQEVFDVSGAGDTVIATFTLAIAAGASPAEATILSNHAAGIVVGKVGTATTGAKELLASFGK